MALKYFIFHQASARVDTTWFSNTWEIQAVGVSNKGKQLEGYTELGGSSFITFFILSTVQPGLWQ